MTRTGKIARLTRTIREELNRRLDNGEPGPQLVTWLNSLENTQKVLLEHFDGKPITEQNLSDWRQGGFQDWLHEQSTRAWVRSLADRAKGVSDDIGIDPLSSPLAVALGRSLERLAAGDAADPAAIKQLLAVTRGLAHLRRSDHEQQRIRISRIRRI